MSILSHLSNEPVIRPLSVRILYTTRPLTGRLGDILFYTRIRGLLSAKESVQWTLDLYLTGPPPASERPEAGESGDIKDEEKTGAEGVSIHRRRITHEDLLAATGPVEGRKGVVAYVCGPARMTDEFVNVLQTAEGMSEERVLCEKWW